MELWFWLCQRNSPFASYAGLISFAAFFLFERVFAVDVVSLSMPAKLSLSKITGCHAEVAFVTHGMIRPDNFSTRKSGNTLGPGF